MPVAKKETPEEKKARWEQMIKDNTLIRAAKSESDITYFDDNQKIVEKDKATYAVIRVFDENGNLINEIFGTIDRQSKKED